MQWHITVFIFDFGSLCPPYRMVFSSLSPPVLMFLCLCRFMLGVKVCFHLSPSSFLSWLWESSSSERREQPTCVALIKGALKTHFIFHTAENSFSIILFFPCASSFMCRLLLIIGFISRHHQSFLTLNSRCHTLTHTYPPPPLTAPPPPPPWPPPPPSLEHKTSALIFCRTIKPARSRWDEVLPSTGAVETVVVRKMTIDTTSRFLSGQNRPDHYWSIPIHTRRFLI